MYTQLAVTLRLEPTQLRMARGSMSSRAKTPARFPPKVLTTARMTFGNPVNPKSSRNTVSHSIVSEPLVDRLSSLTRNDGTEAMMILNELPSNEPDSIGFTPLMWAIRLTPQKFVFDLIDRGADVNVVCPVNMTTPLMIAVKCNRKMIVSKLLKAGSNVDSVDSKQKTAFIHAIEYGEDNVSMVKRLLTKNPDLERTGSRGLNALFTAISRRCDQTAILLIENGANVNAIWQDTSKYSALMFAAMFGRIQVVRELIKHGADVNYNTPSNFGALKVAVARNYEKIACNLVYAGAEASIKGNKRKLLLIAQHQSMHNLVAVIKEMTLD